MPETAGTGPLLLLGPLLRHVDPVSATIWVETDRPCQVEVLGRRARTFCVDGHHYALVVVEDLEPGSTTPYEVRLDDVQVWPPRDSAFPPAGSGRPAVRGRSGCLSVPAATPASARSRSPRASRRTRSTSTPAGSPLCPRTSGPTPSCSWAIRCMPTSSRSRRGPGCAAAATAGRRP